MLDVKDVRELLAAFCLLPLAHITLVFFFLDDPKFIRAILDVRNEIC